MKLLASLLIGFVLAGGMAVYTKEDILKDYNKMFSAKVATKGDQQVVQRSIFKLPEDHFLAGLVNENPRMMEFLVNNYTSITQAQLDSMATDQDALEDAYVAALKKDSVFNQYFMEMAGHYLTSQNSSIKGEEFTKDTLSIDSLSSIAARFFHADTLRPDGNISWKIGTGITNMAKFQQVHRPVAEALAYEAILTNYNTSAIKSDFMTGASQVQGENKVVPGQISDSTLVAVREGVYKYMTNSAALKQVLTKEYEEKKNVLNFVLQPQ